MVFRMRYIHLMPHKSDATRAGNSRHPGGHCFDCEKQLKRPRNFRIMWVLEGTESNPGKSEAARNIVCGSVNSICDLKLVPAAMRWVLGEIRRLVGVFVVSHGKGLPSCVDSGTLS